MKLCASNEDPLKNNKVIKILIKFRYNPVEVTTSSWEQAFLGGTAELLKYSLFKTVLCFNYMISAVLPEYQEESHLLLIQDSISRYLRTKF